VSFINGSLEITSGNCSPYLLQLPLESVHIHGVLVLIILLVPYPFLDYRQEPLCATTGDCVLHLSHSHRTDPPMSVCGLDW
jgi:hypothetical protein